MRRPIVERIAAKFLVGDDCWEWTAGLTPAGYGYVWDGDQMVPAHRAIYELLVGSIPEGMVIDHLCRTRACVRPAHMEVTTHAVNILRGTGQSARNAVKTHCKNGHEFTEDNIYWRTNRNGNPARACRTCTLDGQRERYQCVSSR